MAALVGAAVALVAPWITTSTNRRTGHRDAQRQVAAEILDLVSNTEKFDEEMNAGESTVRRRLYALSVRLDNEAARTSCLRVIAAAGNPELSETEWPAMMDAVGTVYRQRR